MGSEFKQERIEVICGPMFAGKTEELLRRLNRFKYAKIPFLVFKPKLDTRSKNELFSRSGLRIDSFEINNANEIIQIAKEYSDRKVIAIDEAQFFDNELIDVMNKLSKEGYYIILSGLDKDSRGEPFGIMPKLLCIADSVNKLTAICTICGDQANFTQRITKDDLDKDIILIGDSESYEARCRKHFRINK